MCAESSTLAEGMKFKEWSLKFYSAAQQEFNLLLACFEVRLCGEKAS
jgi:hypothetical protein